MAKLLRATLVIALLPAALLAASSFSSPRPTDHLRWLTGCWRQTRGRATVEERWSPPRGGMLMGVGQTVHGDSTLEFEFTLIRERGAQVVYEAHPDGQPMNIFPAKQLSDSLVEFEDLHHDFPQRVGYRKQGPDSLIAWIEGTTPSGPRHIDFPYARIRCEG